MTSPTIRMPRPGPGNGCRQTIASGQPQLEADLAHLVLEQRAQRLDQGELQVVRQAADVVVGLDVRGARAAAGLHDVRVERALHQEVDRLAVRTGLGDHLAGGLLEDPDELAPDDLALLLGVADAGQRVEEALRGVGHLQPYAGRRDEVTLHLLGLALAEQAVVDEHAGELVAHGTVHQSSGHRRVDPAGQPADHPAVADLGPDRRDLLVDDVGHRPGRLRGRPPRTGSARAPPGRARCAGPRGGTARRQGAGRGPRRPRPGCRWCGPRPRTRPAPRTPRRCATSRPAARRGSPWNSVGSPPTTSRSVRPNSALPVRATVPPRASAIAWKP